jgi:hypothetical protein
MRIHLLALVFAACSTTLAAQGVEWTTNGSFTGTLAPWVMGGAYSVNPGLEIGWDTTGMGASDSFGVNAGGQVTPPPYAPNWIEQPILVVQGLTYEFRCDASGARPNAPTVNNADIGTITIEVDNVQIAQHAFANYTVGQIKRAQIGARFTPTTTGTVNLRIYFERRYLGGASNPRMNIDNVSVRDAVGPTFWVQGNRMLGANVTYEVRGTPGALFATMAALALSPAPIPIPGVAGSYMLDLVGSVGLVIGTLDAGGANSIAWTVPNVPLLLQYPIYYQAGMFDTAPSIGYHFGIVASQ